MKQDRKVGFGARLFAAIWSLMGILMDWVLKDIKENKLQMKNISGRVLEFGAGRGENIQYYPRHNIEPVFIEPNQFMYSTLHHAATSKKFERGFKIVTKYLECAELDNESFDVVICTLVLCSVPDANAALKDVYRVLKPGGKFYFIEHVASSSHIGSFIQNILATPWKRVCDGCNLNRRTRDQIEAFPWKIEREGTGSMMGSPIVWGQAVKPKNRYT